MHIPVPIGTKYVASVEGRFLKIISCAHCHEFFAFHLDLRARGESHDVLFVGGAKSAAEARKKAQENLLSKGKNVVIPVPCPSCGNYQKDMVEKLKEDVSINPAQITGAVILLLAFLPLAFSRSIFCVCFTVVAALIGIAVIVKGILQTTRFDPNAGDPEPRKASGRSKTLWGKELEELRAAAENPEESAE
jgi:hypothetical protein